MITQLELRTLLWKQFPFAQTFVLDATYDVVTDEAMATFLDELAAKLRSEYGDKWEEFFDCDNFSLEAIVLAYRKHYLARKAGKGSAQGVAFGILCFLMNPQDRNSGHCVAWRVAADKASIQVFEPQTRQPLSLTLEQCASAFFVFAS